jgi:deoxyribonuclease (pyrimidine dimer)
MTRVNADINPKKLKRPHLLAELREITMVPASLRRSLRTQSVSTVLNKIPEEFTLGRGHVLFFYNKMEFLHYRFNRLADEMERRGYVPDRTRASAFTGFHRRWMQDWTADKKANRIVRTRIAEKIAQKPHLYKD